MDDVVWLIERRKDQALWCPAAKAGQSETDQKTWGALIIDSHGLLSNPTPAARPCPRERVFMPHSRHSFPRLRLSLSGMKADIRSRTIWLAEVVPLVIFGDATPAAARIESP
jgi:hypothetical protein